MGSDNYIFVVGHGRSGTKWIMGLLDASPGTYCRNEPDAIAGSALETLMHHRDIWRREIGPMESGWDGAIRATSNLIGQRDLRTRNPKTYLNEVSRRLGAERVILGPKLRRLARLATPSLRGNEWPMPWWLGSADELSKAVAVIKTVQTPGWAVFVLRHRPSVPVLHILRHPGGYINSWLNRYVSTTDPSEVTLLNRRRLHDIADEDPEWAGHFGNIDIMGMVESELWYWRYASETIHQHGSGSPNYHLIVFERLAQETVPIMKRIYESSGLPWSKATQQAVTSESVDSTRISEDWKYKLPEEYRKLVDSTLRESPLGAFWDTSCPRASG